MFNTKKTQLFVPPAKTPKFKSVAEITSSPSAKTPLPIFVQSAQKKSFEILSGNGALKYSSTGNEGVNQFAKVGSYKKPRPFNEIEKDCELLWAEDPLNSVKFIHYLRTITRKVQLIDGSVTAEPQKGGELKHEAIMRMIWLFTKSPDTFWKNIGWFIALGSWHDIFTMLQYDLVYNGWESRVLDWNKMGNVILVGLADSHTSELVKKYLPQIKARSDCKTVESQANTTIGKWICSLLFGPKETSYNYKTYRKLKSGGTAHQWQQLISQKKFDQIDFGAIHGRALHLLVRSKFLKNQNLSDKFATWVKKPDTVVRYTGFVHELFTNIPTALSGMAAHVRDTVNKQFDTLVAKGKSETKEDSCTWLPVLDTSGSMGAQCTGTNASCLTVAKSLALYFSEFLTGKFMNSFVEFNTKAKMHTWQGATPIEKWYNNRCSHVGSTNFQSVIDLYVDLKNQGIEEAEFPTGILAISDSEFNPTSLGKTNVEVARAKLRQAGFSDTFVDKFQIVLWNLQSGYYGASTGKKFETGATEKGTYYFGGFNGSVISFLTNHEVKTPAQLFLQALDQQVLNYIEL